MRQLVTALPSFCLLGLALAVAACGPANRQPVFEDIPDQEAFVGKELVLDLRASDPDGDVLTFGFSAPSIPDLITRTDAATVSPLGTDGSQARFRWKPVARDVGSWLIDFEVTDGDSNIAESATITVKPEVGANGSPTFVKPGGGSVDLDLAGSTKCVDLDLVVEDPDSAQVAIAQEPVVQEGMVLTDNHDKSAKWHWCPTATQIAGADRYRVHFSADDGVSGKSVKSLLINLIKPQQMNCPGTAPTITHAPSNVTSSENIKISASISDDKGLPAGGEPLLYYALSTPPMPVDLTNSAVWQSVAATLESGSTMSGTWAAVVPNPVASMPAGTKKTVFYVWSARDNDDTMGDCDHTTYEPRTATFQMTVTSSGAGTQAVCTACTADAQCGGATDNCLNLSDGKFCGKACTADTECSQPDYTCSDAALTSVDGAMARQCVPRDGTCTTTVPMTCTDDTREPNDNLVMASTTAAIDPTMVYNLKMCPVTTGGADEDWLKLVVAGSDAEMTFMLTGGTETDLDLQLTNMAGTGVGSPAASNGSNETLTRCLTPGTYYVRIYSRAQTVKDMAYKLQFSAVNKSCAPQCTDDAGDTGGKSDDDKAHARDIFLPLDGKFEAKAQQICTMDDDWYAFKLFQGETLYASLAFAQANALQDLDLNFHDVDGTDLTPCDDENPICDPATGQSSDANEYFERPIDADGTYFVRVNGYAGSENKYDLCLSVNAGQCPKF